MRDISRTDLDLSFATLWFFYIFKSDIPLSVEPHSFHDYEPTQEGHISMYKVSGMVKTWPNQMSLGGAELKCNICCCAKYKVGMDVQTLSAIYASHLASQRSRNVQGEDRHLNPFKMIAG